MQTLLQLRSMGYGCVAVLTAPLRVRSKLNFTVGLHRVIFDATCTSIGLDQSLMKNITSSKNMFLCKNVDDGFTF